MERNERLDLCPTPTPRTLPPVTTMKTAGLLALLVCVVGCGDDGVSPVDMSTEPCATDSDCDDGAFCNGTEVCDPDASAAGGNGCLPGTPPCPLDRCDESANECGPSDCTNPDQDGDGADATECGGNDCDDTDPNRSPLLTEVCDTEGVDEDCDDTTFGDLDADEDGYVSAECCNGATCGDDCDDADAGSHPDESESCDTADNDCDGMVDEGTTTMCWPDMDNDGFAAADAEPVFVCGDCGTDLTGTSPSDPANADCNDEAMNVRPGAPEICDGLDNDCSSGTGLAPAEDMDGDMHSPPSAACDVVTGSFPKDDCHDFNADVFTGQTAYFDEPTCAAGAQCTCVGGRRGCMHPMLGCDCDLPGDPLPGTNSWDYDCSGSVEREPAAACGGCAIAPPFCGQPGPTWSVGNPDCGATVSRIESCGSCGACTPTSPVSSTRGCR